MIDLEQRETRAILCDGADHICDVIRYWPRVELTDAELEEEVARVLAGRYGLAGSDLRDYAAEAVRLWRAEGVH